VIGIVVATHGKMSNGLLDAAKLIIGDNENMVALNLNLGDDVQKLSKQMLEAIDQLDHEDGVIIFTDLFGASPYNQATIATQSLDDDLKGKTFVITGVNLPMLLEAINQKMMGASIRDAVDAVLETARTSVVLWPDGNAEAAEDDDEF